jgi:hypothetical protein
MIMAVWWVTAVQLSAAATTVHRTKAQLSSSSCPSGPVSWTQKAPILCSAILSAGLLLSKNFCKMFADSQLSTVHCPQLSVGINHYNGSQDVR